MMTNKIKELSENLLIILMISFGFIIIALLGLILMAAFTFTIVEITKLLQ